MSASQSQKAIKKKKYFMPLTPCTKGGNPVVLGSELTCRQSKDCSHASPGYVREQSWLL